MYEVKGIAPVTAKPNRVNHSLHYLLSLHIPISKACLASPSGTGPSSDGHGLKLLLFH